MNDKLEGLLLAFALHILFFLYGLALYFSYEDKDNLMAHFDEVLRPMFFIFCLLAVTGVLLCIWVLILDYGGPFRAMGPKAIIIDNIFDPSDSILG